MPPVTVLVTFYSRCGATETLASAAAVGAVQARANIRLRRVLDENAERTLTQFPQCRDTLVRMYKEYVAPTEADVLGVDAIVLVPPSGADASSVEWSDYLRVLTKLGAEGKLAGKVGAVVDAGSASTVQAFSAALAKCGLPLPPDTLVEGPDPAERARELGRRIVGAVRRV